MEESKKRKQRAKLSRRQFVSRTAAVAAGLTIIPGGIISAKGRIAPKRQIKYCRHRHWGNGKNEY